MIKVLVVDDSAVARRTLRALLESDPEIEVIATASDPYVAVEKMRREKPDVITLDIEMPRMNGLTFLRRLMAQHPIPVVVCSGHTPDGSELAFQAMELGAVEVIEKPRLGEQVLVEESKIRICDAVKAAACAVLQMPGLQSEVDAAPMSVAKAVDKVVVIGASTGGTEALRLLFAAYPVDGPGMVVVQHMHASFTGAFARRLDGLSKITVKEAASGDAIVRGHALIASGDSHVEVKGRRGKYQVEVFSGPLVSRHRPSVDVLFRSAASQVGADTIAVIMTGMGKDGAEGMKEIHDAGGYTVAQSEETCVIFGMPGEAIKCGGVDKVVPLGGIVQEVVRATHPGAR